MTRVISGFLRLQIDLQGTYARVTFSFLSKVKRWNDFRAPVTLLPDPLLLKCHWPHFRTSVFPQPHLNNFIFIYFGLRDDALESFHWYFKIANAV